MFNTVHGLMAVPTSSVISADPRNDVTTRTSSNASWLQLLRVWSTGAERRMDAG